MTGRQGRRARWSAVAATVVVVLSASACGTAGLKGVSPVQTQAQAVGGSCVADADEQMRDIDGHDYEAAWPHTPGQEVTVHFAYGGLPQRYAQFVRTGAELWSRSPCVRAVAVDRCPESANCSVVTVKEYAADDDRDTDGDSDSEDRKGVRQSNRLTLYTGLLDRASDSGALATTVHEMGHALGLMHRKTKSSVMYEDTIEMTNAVPDDTDYRNLVVVYGGGRPPGD